jgi:hypothetical protein
VSPRTSERARRRLGDGEFDEEPAQALLVPRALTDEILTMVDEEADLAIRSVERGDRQVGFAQDGPGDGQRVDRIALAWLTSGAAGPRPLAWARLGRPPRRPARARRRAAGSGGGSPRGPTCARAIGRPSGGARGGPRRLPRSSSRPAADQLHRSRRWCAPLVQIRAQDHHVRVSSSSEVTIEGRSADTPEWGRSHAPDLFR